MLRPVGAEMLTRKFDEIDQLTTKEEQSVLSIVIFVRRTQTTC